MLKNNSGNTFMTVIIIVVGIVLLFFIPLMAASNTQDDVTKVAVQSIVAELVQTASTKGKLTTNDYENFTTKLYATGNTYDIQLIHTIMTTNPNKGATDKAGENLSYSVYNTEILDNGINKSTNHGEYLMNKGDYFGCTVKNTNTTMADQIKGAIFRVIGKDTYTIVGSDYALVVTSGNYSN